LNPGGSPCIIAMIARHETTVLWPDVVTPQGEKLDAHNLLKPLDDRAGMSCARCGRQHYDNDN
jgi:hypothetical protein